MDRDNKEICQHVEKFLKDTAHLISGCVVFPGGAGYTLENGVLVSSEERADAKVTDNETERGQDCSISFEFIEMHGEPSLGLKTTDEKALFNATGFSKKGSVENIILAILNTLLKAEGDLEKKKLKGDRILSAMTELGPRDGFEGLLIIQMLVTYDRAMECFKVAENIEPFTEKDFSHQNQGIRLMCLYNQQLEALDRHRRRGEEASKNLQGG